MVKPAIRRMLTKRWLIVAAVVMISGGAVAGWAWSLSGLHPGDQVILANLSQPLPTTNAQNARRGTAGNGGRPGG